MGIEIGPVGIETGPVGIDSYKGRSNGNVEPNAIPWDAIDRIGGVCCFVGCVEGTRDGPEFRFDDADASLSLPGFGAAFQSLLDDGRLSDVISFLDDGRSSDVTFDVVVTVVCVVVTATLDVGSSNLVAY